MTFTTSTCEKPVGEVGTHPVPLVVDLDGTLLRSDLLIETAFAFAGNSSNRLLEAVRSLRGGRARLKQYLAGENVTLASLPFDEIIVERARTAARAGVPVDIASASDEKLVRAIGEHFGFFSGWFASDGTINLSAEMKARRLVEFFGQAGFDYIGNDAADLPVWAVCRQRAAIRISARVRNWLLAIDPELTISWMNSRQFKPGPGYCVCINTSRIFSVCAVARLPQFHDSGDSAVGRCNDRLFTMRI